MAVSLLTKLPVLLPAEGKSLEEVAAIAQRFADNMATLAVAVRGATHPSTGAALATLAKMIWKSVWVSMVKAAVVVNPWKTTDETQKLW